MVGVKPPEVVGIKKVSQISHIPNHKCNVTIDKKNKPCTLSCS